MYGSNRHVAAAVNLASAGSWTVSVSFCTSINSETLIQMLLSLVFAPLQTNRILEKRFWDII